MDQLPDFLPEIINLDGTYEEIIDRLYQVFCKDFIETRAHHLCLHVTFNTVIEKSSQGKVEGFWHVITCDDSTKTNRLIDYRRAERLSWSKPLMGNPHHHEIVFFYYNEGTIRRGIRHYIWFKQGHYVVILKKRKYDYYWITAFYVESWKENDLKRKYENRIGP